MCKIAKIVDFVKVYRYFNIISKPPEYGKPRNVELMFFNKTKKAGCIEPVRSAFCNDAGGTYEKSGFTGNQAQKAVKELKEEGLHIFLQRPSDRKSVV